jgi:feruloyl esterase
MNNSLRTFFVITIILALGLAAWTAPFSSDALALGKGTQNDAIRCENIVKMKLKNTIISSASIVAAGTELPPPVGNVPVTICRVVGAIDTNINFEVWMPVAGWNGKFNGVGNGGLAGFINYGSMRTAVTRGYATTSTDTGHQAFLGDGSWALGHPELLVDFGYRAIHLTTVTAKTIVTGYYKQKPRYSYFTGCSGGGQQGLAEAQRYPKDYDGIVSGAPANYPTHMWPGELWPAWVTVTDPQGLINKLPLVTNAALAACDAHDGVTDGVLDDPRSCSFDPATLLCSGADSPDCLTATQVDWVKEIYAGLKDPTTAEQFWPGYEISSEINWGGHIIPFTIPISYFKYMVYEDPSWDYHTYDLTDPQNFEDIYEADSRLGPILNATDPNLTPFWARGGKLIMYHGWIDQNIAPRNSISYYESVVEKMGSKDQWKTSEFLRLFMAPGMGHCSGGPGPNTFDMLAALEQWVEKGIAPNRIIASHLTGGVVDRTRPLCPYPQVARWTGTGSTDDAENFVCVDLK